MALFETLKYRVVKKDKSIGMREYQVFYCQHDLAN